MLNPRRRSDGEVPERSNGAVSKTVVLFAGDRGFESLPLRQSPISCRRRASGRPLKTQAVWAAGVFRCISTYRTIACEVGETTGDRSRFPFRAGAEANGAHRKAVSG